MVFRGLSHSDIFFFPLPLQIPINQLPSFFFFFTNSPIILFSFSHYSTQKITLIIFFGHSHQTKHACIYIHIIFFFTPLFLFFVTLVLLVPSLFVTTSLYACDLVYSITVQLLFFLGTPLFLPPTVLPSLLSELRTPLLPYFYALFFSFSCGIHPPPSFDISIFLMNTLPFFFCVCSPPFNDFFFSLWMDVIFFLC